MNNTLHRCFKIANAFNFFPQMHQKAKESLYNIHLDSLLFPHVSILNLLVFNHDHGIYLRLMVHIDQVLLIIQRGGSIHSAKVSTRHQKPKPQQPTPITTDTLRLI
jgi:hypothetical protein